jgi:hypothetical protein
MNDLVLDPLNISGNRKKRGKKRKPSGYEGENDGAYNGDGTDRVAELMQSLAKEEAERLAKRKATLAAAEAKALGWDNLDFTKDNELRGGKRRKTKRIRLSRKRRRSSRKRRRSSRRR